MSKIKVALRTRPLSFREKEEGHPVVVDVEDNSAFITDIRVPEKPAADSRQRFRQFDFDHGFWLTDCGGWGASQEEVYQEMGPNIENSILEGYNACLLAYGQSGTGKTHTMLGTKSDPGIIPRLCQSLWEKLRESRENSDFKMEVSFMEIYREKVRDLLTPDKPLKLREHPQNGPHVQDLTRVEVSEEIGLVDLLWEGERRRAIGTTGSNRRSSRSHAIWTLYLTYHKTKDYHNLITNQVHLVDLAGSEKAELTTTKNLLAEGADINRSLVSLGNVISSLAEKAQHIPYRDSALTWLLKDSLGGNATTSIIITASPASCCHAQTLNSLRFAQRARLVENQPKVNLSTENDGSTVRGVTVGSSSIVSIFDIRKDISRLANILKVAQNNGGILRGLTPRNGWNRLITAIESWNHVHGDKEGGPEGGDSMDTSSSTQASTSTASTMTSNANNSFSTKSLNDVMVQADLHSFEDRHHHPHRRRASTANPNPNRSSRSSMSLSGASSSSSPDTANQSQHRQRLLSNTSSKSRSPSGSIKCLTWSQSELSSLPKSRSIDESDDDTNFLSPPQTPKVHHLKYLGPIRVTPQQNIEPEARINEKIRGNLNTKGPDGLQIVPKIVQSDCENNFVLIRHRLPTLVNAQRVDVEYVDSSNNTNKTRRGSPKRKVGDGGSESVVNYICPPGEGNNGEGDQNQNQLTPKKAMAFQNFIPDPPKPFLVCHKASAKKRTHRPPPKIKEFIIGKPEKLHVFESTDEGEFSDCLEIQLNHSANKNYRTVNKTQVEIREAHVPTEEDSLEEMLLFYSGSGTSSDGPGSGCGSGRASASSSKKGKSNRKSKSKSNCSGSGSNSSSSSSSSYESLVFQKPAGHVKIVENAIYEFVEDHCVDVPVEDCDFKNLEKHVTAISFGQLEEGEVSDAVDEEAEPISGEFEELKPMDGSNNSKFSNFYVRELQQLDQIGKQIKSLRNLSQRYDVLKPYLKEIEDLQTVDWTKEDPVLDAQIEHCSGWNVDIEYRKVQNEVLSIGKILKGGNCSASSGAANGIVAGLLGGLNFNGAGTGTGGGSIKSQGQGQGHGVGVVQGGPRRRDSSSTSNRTTSSTSITSDSYSLNTSATTNTDSRRGSFASSSFIFDSNPLQHQQYQPQHQNPHPFNLTSPKHPSNYLELENSLFSYSSMSSAPNSLPSLFSLNIGQNQIPNPHQFQQNPNQNSNKISNNLNFYQQQLQQQQQQQQQQLFLQQQQHQQQSQYFNPPLNFDYRRGRGIAGGSGSGSGSGSGCNIENSNSNSLQNFEMPSPTRQNYNNYSNTDFPNGGGGFYPTSQGPGQGQGYASGSSSSIHNNYPQKLFGSGSGTPGPGPGHFQGHHLPLPMDLLSSPNSNSVALGNSCPSFHENGFQQFYQQQQQMQAGQQRSPVTGIPIPVPVPVPVPVPGPIPNSWSPAHNHNNFNAIPPNYGSSSSSFYGSGHGPMTGTGTGGGGGGSMYTNTTPPTKLNGVVKNNGTAFDFDPMKYQEFNHYGDLDSGIVTAASTTATFGFPNSSSNLYGNAIVKKYSPTHHNSSGNGGDSLGLVLDPSSSSQSLTGGFSNLSLTTTTTSSSFCKSCCMDFCSCQESLSSTLTKTSDRSHPQSQQQQPQQTTSFDFPLQVQSQGQSQSQSQKVKSRGQRLNGKFQTSSARAQEQSNSPSGGGTKSSKSNKGSGSANNSNGGSNKRQAYPHHRAKTNQNNYNHSRSAVTATMISSYD